MIGIDGCSCASQIEILRNVLFITFAITMLLFFVTLKIVKWVEDIEVKLLAQTSPEHKALTRAYFNKLYNAHMKEKDYDKRLDKMFEEDK